MNLFGDDLDCRLTTVAENSFDEFIGRSNWTERAKRRVILHLVWATIPIVEDPFLGDCQRLLLRHRDENPHPDRRDEIRYEHVLSPIGMAHVACARPLSDAEWRHTIPAVPDPFDFATVVADVFHERVGFAELAGENAILHAASLNPAECKNWSHAHSRHFLASTSQVDLPPVGRDVPFSQKRQRQWISLPAGGNTAPITI
ncbi:hypothetical protein [Pseudaminobacter salicylatoxidans]|uniref:hypothetical protein n=1 Tax=Pseudaminobacter salicylatoxidans TaxID=93369 RepID=UPI0011B2369B|nr:hypothetical protein [Pseudaminobacter salicylatoxidans]